MSKKLYENIQELEKAINKYLETEENPTPRHFRAIGIKLKKSTLSNWKHQEDRKEHLNLIQDTQDYILALMEHKFAKGGRDAFNISYILRAWDNPRYNPNYIKQDNFITQAPVQIVLPSSMKEKGVQSEREIKLIK